MNKLLNKSGVFFDFEFTLDNGRTRNYRYELTIEDAAEAVRACFDKYRLDIKGSDSNLFRLCDMNDLFNVFSECDEYIEYCNDFLRDEAYDEFIEYIKDNPDDEEEYFEESKQVDLKEAGNIRQITEPINLADDEGNVYSCDLTINISEEDYERYYEMEDFDYILNKYFDYNFDLGYFVEKQYFVDCKVYDELTDDHVSISYQEYKDFAGYGKLPDSITSLDDTPIITEDRNYTTYEGSDLDEIKEKLIEDAWDGYRDAPYLYDVEEPNEDDFIDYVDYENAYEQFKKDIAEEIDNLVNDTLSNIKAIHIEEDIIRVQPFGPDFWGVPYKSVVELKDGRIFVVDDEEQYSLFNLCELVLAREVNKDTFDLDAFFN